MKILSHEALAHTSVRNQTQLPRTNRTQHQRQSRTKNLMYKLMEPATLVTRMRKGSVKAKMMTRMTKPRTETQRDQRVCYHLPEIKTTPASSHARIESTMLESIAFDTGALVP
jgi:hypothetical protein